MSVHVWPSRASHVGLFLVSKCLTLLSPTSCSVPDITCSGCAARAIHFFWPSIQIPAPSGIGLSVLYNFPLQLPRGLDNFPSLSGHNPILLVLAVLPELYTTWPYWHAKVVHHMPLWANQYPTQLTPHGQPEPYITWSGAPARALHHFQEWSATAIKLLPRPDNRSPISLTPSG